MVSVVSVCSLVTACISALIHVYEIPYSELPGQLKSYMIPMHMIPLPLEPIVTRVPKGLVPFIPPMIGWIADPTGTSLCPIENVSVLPDL